jgi:outer membrane protein OmpA-like peptidoglycan-associated protein
MLTLLLAGLAVLALLFILLRSCGDRGEQAEGVNTTTTEATTSTTTDESLAQQPVGAQPALGPPEAVSLPNGQTVNVARGGFAWTLQQYLASTEAGGRSFEFDGLHFASNSAELGQQSQPTVASLVSILQAYPNARVRVDGHTDEVGDPAGNKKLSEERAAAVAQAIIAGGVQPQRVTSAGYGETRPAATNATGAGRAENRRTELTVVSK